MYAITASDPSPALNCLPGSRTSNSIPRGGTSLPASPPTRASPDCYAWSRVFSDTLVVAPDVHIIKSPLPHPMVSVVMHRERERERLQHPLAPRRLRGSGRRDAGPGTPTSCPVPSFAALDVAHTSDTGCMRHPGGGGVRVVELLLLQLRKHETTDFSQSLVYAHPLGRDSFDDWLSLPFQQILQSFDGQGAW
jgi:hypothetical protein